MTPQELKNSILQMAIQGKLVEQRAEEGTAQELLDKLPKPKKPVQSLQRMKSLLIFQIVGHGQNLVFAQPMQRQSPKYLLQALRAMNGLLTLKTSKKKQDVLLILAKPANEKSSVIRCALEKAKYSIASYAHI